MDGEMIIYILFIVMLATFLGVELISKVPSTLHTPLMSGSNAISGITLLGALSLAGSALNEMSVVLAIISVAMATINVVGGYLVTHRMLDMFKKKEKD
ncbi:NAD(P) transhydrogenase subunit alpha [Candidatus Marinamargulisbacteria bacterium SCGC AG-343-D04]|nr:NAD(P) transhydrogenase subunit alpha [Candidatus Marinamargulisbacteria bacterium SCGC AG-343-D04]